MLQKFSYINLFGKVWDIKTKTPWFNKEPLKLFKDKREEAPLKKEEPLKGLLRQCLNPDYIPDQHEDED
jgi:hypothetical protein